MGIEATSRGFWTEIKTGDLYLGASDRASGPGQEVGGRGCEKSTQCWPLGHSKFRDG